MNCDACAPEEETPNHMIVWLDLNIGRRDNNQRLKAAFSSTADPRHIDPVRLIDQDDDQINRVIGFQKVNFEGVEFLLAAFANVERCVQFLQDNQDKRIFLITSGQIGRVAVPLIMFKCPNLFIDPVTREPYAFIYVYCHSINRHVDWMIEYRDYLAPPFNFDADLLARMTRDIADYFVKEGKRRLEVKPKPNYAAAYNRLTWARILYERYRTMEADPLKTEFAEVNKLMDQVENGMRPSSDNED